MEPITPPAVVGESVAGEAQKVRKQINAIINGVNKSTFTLAELLHKVKVTPTLRPEQTFGEYANGLELKISKSYYLVRIIDSMLISGIDKSVYEPVGIAKLRVISKIDPVKDYQGKPGAEYIKGLVENAPNVEMELLKEAVATVMGQTGDEARVWLNISCGKSQRDDTILPAIELAKKHLGTVATNAEGEPQDASDGRALEMVCAAFLVDEANEYTPPAPVTIVPVPQADGISEEDQ